MKKDQDKGYFDENSEDFVPGPEEDVTGIPDEPMPGEGVKPTGGSPFSDPDEPGTKSRFSDPLDSGTPLQERMMNMEEMEKE